jgi:hypothetical protein
MGFLQSGRGVAVRHGKYAGRLRQPGVARRRLAGLGLLNGVVQYGDEAVVAGGSGGSP